MLSAIKNILFSDPRKKIINHRARLEVDNYQTWLGEIGENQNWENFVIYLHRCNDCNQYCPNQVSVPMALENWIELLRLPPRQSRAIRTVFQHHVFAITSVECATFFDFAAKLRDGKLNNQEF